MSRTREHPEVRRTAAVARLTRRRRAASRHPHLRFLDLPQDAEVRQAHDVVRDARQVRLPVEPRPVQTPRAPVDPAHCFEYLHLGGVHEQRDDRLPIGGGVRVARLRLLSGYRWHGASQGTQGAALTEHPGTLNQARRLLAPRIGGGYLAWISPGFQIETARSIPLLEPSSLAPQRSVKRGDGRACVRRAPPQPEVLVVV